MQCPRRLALDSAQEVFGLLNLTVNLLRHFLQCAMIRLPVAAEVLLAITSEVAECVRAAESFKLRHQIIAFGVACFDSLPHVFDLLARDNKPFVHGEGSRRLVPDRPF